MARVDGAPLAGLFGTDGTVDHQAEYELREARSEIARHHKLIADMREALEWSLRLAGLYIDEAWSQGATDEDQLLLNEYTQLLNRQVG